MPTIRTTDWAEAWSSDTPIRVAFTDGTFAYLSIEAALARLDDQWTADAARDYLVQQGQKLTRWNGSTYVLESGPSPEA